MRSGFFLLSAVILTSCASTPAGLEREQAVYRAATNTVSVIDRYVVPVTPEPYRGAAELLIGLVGAGLAAWNLHQQKAIKRLQNGASEKIDMATSDH